MATSKQPSPGMPASGQPDPDTYDGDVESRAPISDQEADDGLPSDGPRVVAKTSELLKPLLRDPAQAPVAAAAIVASIETHEGPLPHPRILVGYEDIVPGAARDILDMAKKEQGHRHRMELMESAYPYIALLSGSLALFGCLAGAVYLAATSASTQVPLALLGAPLIGAIGWLVRSRLKLRPAPDYTPPP